MAWTNVRYSRDRLVSNMAPVTPWEVTRLVWWQDMATHQKYLIGFLAVQVLQWAVLTQSQPFALDYVGGLLAVSVVAIALVVKPSPQLASPSAGPLSGIALAHLSGAQPLSFAELPLSAVGAGPTGAGDGLAFAMRNFPSDQAETCRHETWSDLMGRISHEIRTPLNAVIGFSELMSREMFGPLGHERYGDYVSHIKESGHAVLKSAEDTLALSSLLASSNYEQRPQASSLAALAEDAWTFVEPQAQRRGVTLVRSIVGVIEILGDRRCTRQVVLNLLTEALARTEDNGVIVFSATTQGDVVRVLISVRVARGTGGNQNPSLAISVARALLERQGSSLVVVDGVNGDWNATTILDLAVQPDFFAPHRGAAVAKR
jgi:hypothetical protein